MLDRETIEKIKKACELYGGGLIERWEDGTITEESISAAYDELVAGRSRRNSSISISDFVSTCAIACYKMALARGKI